jgi:exoribonuclease R
MAAAQLMVDAGIGVLRTLPTPPRQTLAELRAVAAGLRVGWHQQVGYAERVRELEPTIPNEAALLSASASGLRGAGYASFVDGDLPADPEHSAIASTYAHVTAPLRRLGDRFANEIVLAVCGGYPPPSWVLEALPEIPKLMGKARDREGRLERGLLDFMEAAVLADRVGEELDAVVSSRRDDDVTVTITDPAVIARIVDTGVELGQRLRVRVVAADPSQSHIELVPVRGP